MSGLRILHFSDVHVDSSFAELPWSTWLSKRALGGLNHALRRRRSFVDAGRKLADLARFADAHEVALSVCTGDCTILGTEREMARAFEAIEPMSRRPFGLAIVPGNHDVYLEDAVRDARFAKYFGKFMTTDLPEMAVERGFPFVRWVGDEVVVVGVESARPNPAPWRSSGRIPDAQLGALERILSRADVRRRFVLVLTHYAPRLWDGRPDTLLHGLENADAFLKVVSGVERGCVLHGHVHRRYAVRVPGVRPLLLGAGSATQAGREGFWLLDVERELAIPGAYRSGQYVLERDCAVSLGSTSA